MEIGKPPTDGWSANDEEGTVGLPTIPKGISARDVLKEMDVARILKDSRLNPERRELSPAELYRLDAELTRGRATLEILASEVKAQTMSAMDVLRARNDFMEYAQGERYEVFSGVETAAESTPEGRTRMFYLYPEEFPELYRLKAERRRHPAAAVRRILAAIGGHGTKQKEQ